MLDKAGQQAAVQVMPPKEPQKRTAPPDYASAPPSEEEDEISSPEKIKKLLPPPPKVKQPSIPIRGEIPPIGGKMPPRDPWADVEDSMDHPQVLPDRTSRQSVLPPPPPRAMRFSPAPRTSVELADVAQGRCCQNKLGTKTTFVSPTKGSSIFSSSSEEQMEPKTPLLVS